MLSRNEEVLSEIDFKNKAEEICDEPKYVLFLCSSTNIDSLMSMASVAKSTLKMFCVDSFQRDILEVISNNSKSDFYKQTLHKIRYPQGLIVALRISQLDFAKQFYKKYGRDSILLYSMWDGYIEKIEGLKKLKELWGNRFLQLHSGGHASADDIKKLVEICSKGREQTMVIPMHLENFQDVNDLCLPATICNLRQSEELVLVP